MSAAFGDQTILNWPSSATVEVKLITGTTPWLGKRNRSYDHFVLSKLEPGVFAFDKILTVPGVVPLFKKQKAYRMPEASKAFFSPRATGFQPGH